MSAGPASAAPGRERVPGSPWVGVGLGLLAVGFAIDLHFDIRARDVFSWMDPYQYYEFALGVLQGRESFDGFEIPSLFPFAVIPLLAVEPSVAASLWINGVALLLLLASLHLLCRELSLGTPSPLVALLVLCSPLLLGLSRTLYVEFTLTAFASASFLLWLRFVRRMDGASLLAFSLVFSMGFLTKLTFPLFVLPTAAGAMLGRLLERRAGDVVILFAAVLVPIGAAMLLHASVFAPSLGYYLNLVSTSLPFMYLMGPPEVLSWSSAGYYLGEIGRTFLFLLTPLLALAVVAVWRGRERGGRLDLAGPQAALWLWLLGPLLLLIAHPLKEPRHVAPCVVPAVLLLVQGIEALPKRGLRRALLALATLLAVAQYAAVSSGRLASPYFLDRSLHYEEIHARMLAADTRRAEARTPPGLRTFHWKYNQNLALTGFDPNESLALTWQGFPGVVFDLDSYDAAEHRHDAIPFQLFEDLFFLAGINTYNRRCGWNGYHETLAREAIVANADFVLANDRNPSELARSFPGHDLVASIEREGGAVHILHARAPTVPFRALYARAFLQRNPGIPDDERRVIARELLMAAVLDSDLVELRRLMREFPLLRGEHETRNIYWIGGYPALIEWAQQYMTGLLRDRHPRAPQHGERGGEPDRPVTRRSDRLRPR